MKYDITKERYYHETSDGHKIVSRFLNDLGEMIIVFKRDNPYRQDYCVGRVYNVFDGTWAGQGTYDYPSEESANQSAWLSGKCRYAFDPSNPDDVQFYLDSRFNFNEACSRSFGDTGSRYVIQKASHRDPSFDLYDYWIDGPRNGGHGTREEFESERARLRHQMSHRAPAPSPYHQPVESDGRKLRSRRFRY